MARCSLVLGLFVQQLCLASGPPPVITVQPVSVNVPLLGIATFSVTATSDTTMSYQWYKDGNAISGAHSSSYSILTVLGTSAGTYCVQVSNSGGSVMSANATLNIYTPPAIYTQPQSQTVNQGQSVSLSAWATGSPTPTYQWYFNGSRVGGSSGTHSTLTLSSVSTTQAGQYWVVAANSIGTATSAVATLTVYVPPAIQMQPTNQSVVLGQNTGFAVLASGSAPLSYQWTLNGTPLPGETTDTLVLAGVQEAQAGTYAVQVSNTAGSIASGNALLMVQPPPLLSAASSVLSPTGFSFQFSVPTGHAYTVLASSDLRTWTPITTNVSLTGTATFTDTAATNYPQRLYRVVAQ